MRKQKKWFIAVCMMMALGLTACAPKEAAEETTAMKQLPQLKKAMGWRLSQKQKRLCRKRQRQRNPLKQRKKQYEKMELIIGEVLDSDERLVIL